MAGGRVSVFGQERSQWRQLQYAREHRREAYSGLIASPKLLSAVCRRLSDVVRNDQSTPEQWQVSFAEAHEVWSRFSSAVAAVVVAGPLSAAAAAEVLRVAMYDCEKAGMDWLEAADNRSVGPVSRAEPARRHGRCP